MTKAKRPTKSQTRKAAEARFVAFVKRYLRDRERLYVRAHLQPPTGRRP